MGCLDPTLIGFCFYRKQKPLNKLPAAKIADANHQHQQHTHFISPLPSSDSSSQGGDSEDSDFRQSTSSEDSVIAESELGEFLMDTFEGLDAMEFNGLLTAS